MTDPAPHYRAAMCAAQEVHVAALRAAETPAALLRADAEYEQARAAAESLIPAGVDITWRGAKKRSRG